MSDNDSKSRQNPLDMSAEEFKKYGYALIDEIANHFETIRDKKVTRGDTMSEVYKNIGQSNVPEQGEAINELLPAITDTLLNRSLFNGHPKFWGYITSTPAPIGVLGDLLASAVNPNVGAHILSPVATTIEHQTIQWIAELIGYPTTGGGLLVSGGNVANFVGFLAGRTAVTKGRIKESGLAKFDKQLVVYCSKTTHTWIDKAADLFGLGKQSVRWVDTLPNRKMDVEKLKELIKKDLKDGNQPLMVIGTAGDVSTGVVDDLDAIANVCEKYQLWFHADGAYGAPAAILPENKTTFKGIEKADSVALDPHKWLYSPLEAGCILVKESQHLLHTFSSNPDYYNFSNENKEQQINYFGHGLQNSRGFRALKVWLSIKQIGREGYTELIREDTRLAKILYNLMDEHPDFEAVTHNLSITTFRYAPEAIKNREDAEEKLNALNLAILNKMQADGDMFMSNAVIDGKYCLRVCIVNFRTNISDIEAVPEYVAGLGEKLIQDMTLLL